ncbi:MAG: MmgE/PrpD family protein [Burkholderiaceae bacterium]|nr:MmgE/PrpD family protein [Burkholderiaceae bacterium]
MKTNVTPSAQLAHFAADLQYDDIPPEVMRRAEDLFVDWVGSALSGKVGRPVQAIESVAREVGPTEGRAEVLLSRRKTTSVFAAMVNAASSHFMEQDDVHNGSVFHPGAVVFPAVLALAQDRGISGKEMMTAAVAGYEVGIRVGEFLGQSHYKVFHTTGTAGTIAAAVAAGRAINLPPEKMQHAIGSAGTQAAGLWEFLKDAANSKQLHTAKAAFDGTLSALLSEKGFSGAKQILEGAKGMGVGLSQDADPARLTDRLGERWATIETSFKFHASCRHTHPAADAFLSLMQQHQLNADQIAAVTTRVHQGAIDVLGQVDEPKSVHQAKFSMGTVLGLLAVYGKAGVYEFNECFREDQVQAFRRRVSMVLDPEVDALYPQRWVGKVTITTTDGRELNARVDEPKGDPGNTLSRAEIEQKAVMLAELAGAATADEMRGVLDSLWRIAEHASVGDLLPPWSQDL